MNSITVIYTAEYRKGTFKTEGDWQFDELLKKMKKMKENIYSSDKATRTIIIAD